MPLSRHLEQGHLLYFKQSPHAISVSENPHFRWLAFNGVLQSVMRKARPHWLTLPHQWALMLPWAYFLNDKLSNQALFNENFPRIVEFGLGGGNHFRFCQWLSPKVNHLVIESSRTVIDISKTYFALSETYGTRQIVHQSAEQWLASQQMISADWLIFDIYRQPKVGDNASHQLLEQLIQVLPAQTILSINFTQATAQSLRFWHGKFQQKLAHNVAFYRVPIYQNIVVHLFPKERLPKDLLIKGLMRKDLKISEHVSAETKSLSHDHPQTQFPRYQKRWQQFHQHYYFKLDKKADLLK
ncbi:hypothetical protein DXX93_01065 [Thalassotalea euphylliae]|uniref:Class I SAM-dependent methyltransferase n=1 Tax=Thalassotalea euphylliae TaxID=1655234 RepID=A0A3E0TL57_9GAMM|nr:hypothetical protein [Thalassotalea euphylliae]REL25284.1 hypothetical protein DXX93_01065 [Thalassotalea euphylliae]